MKPKQGLSMPVKIVLGLAAAVLLSVFFIPKTKIGKPENFNQADAFISQRKLSDAISALSPIASINSDAKKRIEELETFADTFALWSKMTNVKTANIGRLYSGSYTPKIFFHDSLNAYWREFIVRTINKKEWISERLEMERLEKKFEAESKINNRKTYGETLRETYLDNGIDVKIKISGKENTVLTMTYILMSDVEVHQLKKQGVFDQWHNLGFEKAILRDGFNYSKTITWN